VSQTERIFHIDRSIREHGGVTVAEIAKKFEVCERQAKRDIEYMRDRLGAPIVWSVGRRQYKYNSSWDNLRFADEKSLLAFAFLKAIINEYHYVPVISNDILALLKEKIAGRYAGIAEKVSYELPDMESIDGDIAYALCQALLHSCELEITYTDSKGIESARVIAPLRLVNYSGKWYCVALDSKSSEMRTFAISRIRSAKTSQPCRKAISPPNSEIERYLSSSYGIFKGEPIGRATLRFYGGAARAVREQVWHMDQTITPVPEFSPDGEGAPIAPEAINLTLPVHDWTELLGRALRCGANCEVMAPEEFRAQWREEIGRMGKLAENQLFPDASVLSVHDHDPVVH